MSTLENLRATLTAAVVELPPAELPDLIGALAAASARAQARLTAPPSTASATTTVTAKQAAKVFNVPITQVYELARQGRIPSLLIGKYRRFDLAAVRQALTDGASSKTLSLGPRKKRSNGAASSVPATTVQPDAGRV